MNIIKAIDLDNGMKVTVSDESGKVAGDRWLVKVRCEAQMATAHHLDKVVEDTELLDPIGREMGGHVRFVLHKERNFVDEKHKNDVVDESVKQIMNNIERYLASESFPARLFDQRYTEARNMVLTRRQSEQKVDSTWDDDDGPADFSGLFADSD